MTDELNLDAILKKGSFPYAWLATYNFDAPFFERYCLHKYETLATSRVVVFLDQGQHDALLVATHERRPQQAGRRYVLAPVRCRGVFHAKLALFVGADAGLLVLSSANLTRPGLTQNAEFAVALRYGSDCGEHLALFGDAARFFAALATRSRAPSLLEAMEDTRGACPWLPLADDGDTIRPRILHSLDRPLWPQLRAGLPSPVTRCVVLSPYFDAGPRILEQLAPDLGDAPVSLYTQPGPRSLSTRWRTSPKLASLPALRVIPGARTLHAKAILLAHAGETTLAFGSANFTRAGWCGDQSTGNIETVLRVRGLPSAYDVAALFDPRGEARDATDDDLIASPPPPPTRPPAAAIRLLDVRIDGLALHLDLDPVDYAIAHWIVELSPHEGPDVLLALAQPTSSRLTTALDPVIVARCARGATTARLNGTTSAGLDLLSNRVFVTQLQDAGTHRVARMDRKIHEAQASAGHFAIVLDELAAAGDLGDLERFFRCCDLRLGDSSRAFTSRVQVTGDPDSRPPLDARVLAVCADLHEPAKAFVDTHLKRLYRHAQDPTVDALPRFTTIARILAHTLAWQVGVLLAGLAAPPCRRHPQQWRRDRDRFNACLTRFQALYVLLAEQYLPSLSPRFAPEPPPTDLHTALAALAAYAAVLLETRDKFDSLRVTVSGSSTLAGFFPQDLLEDGQWRAWTREVEAAVRRFAAPPPASSRRPRRRS